MGDQRVRRPPSGTRDGEPISIVGRLHEIAQETPDAPAASDANEEVSYSQLWDRAAAVATLIRETAAPAKDRPLGICMSATVTRLAAAMGAMSCGSMYVPIDRTLPDERINAIAGGAGLEYILVDESTADRFNALPFKTLQASQWDEWERPTLVEPDVASGLAIAYAIYTSGSTGVPKGVAVDHGSIASRFRALDEILPTNTRGSGQRWLASSSFSFDMSIVDLYWPLTRRIPVEIADVSGFAGKASGDAEYFAKILASGQITHFQSTPSLVGLLLKDSRLASFLKAVDVVLMGGEIVPPELITELRDVPYVFNGYGPTEATVYTTIHRCIESDAMAGDVPIGKPLRGTELKVVDGEGTEVPEGSVGELLIGGTGLARGYLNDPELTARKFFVSDVNSARWYRTGDLATIAGDGTVRYRGRTDNQVKVRGHRVELGEVEKALRDFSTVEDAVVFPAKNRTGQIVGLVAAVKAGSHDFTQRDFLKGLREVLPAYAIPDSVKFMSEFPLGPTGKVDRRSIERLLTVPGRTSSLREDDESGGAAGDLEGAIARVWRHAIPDLAFDRVPVDENFFDLGGNSAMLSSVLPRLRDIFPSADLSLVDLYRYPTVAALLTRIEVGPSSSSDTKIDTSKVPLSTSSERRRLARSRG